MKGFPYLGLTRVTCTRCLYLGERVIYFACLPCLSLIYIIWDLWENVLCFFVQRNKGFESRRQNSPSLSYPRVWLILFLGLEYFLGGGGFGDIIITPPPVFSVGDRLSIGRSLTLGGESGGPGILGMLAPACLGMLACLKAHTFPLTLGGCWVSSKWTLFDMTFRD